MKKGLNNLAFVCVNFLRPECTKKCITSLKEYYPDVEVFVADQDEPMEEMKAFYKQYDVKVYWLPFDCGLAYSRNFLLNEIIKQKKYKYIMWGDNDFVFDDRNNLEHAVEILEKDKNIDIVGGAVEKNGRTMHYERQILFDEERGIIVLIPLEYTEPEKREIGDIVYYPCDLTFNYAIAKRKVFKDKKIRWHEKIKVKFEHLCIFLTFKKYGYKVAYCPSMRVVHEHIDTPEYRKYRYRTQDSKVFAEHWNVKMSFTIGEGRYLYNGQFLPIAQLKRLKPIEIATPEQETRKQGTKKSLLERIKLIAENNSINVCLAKETCYRAVKGMEIVSPYYIFVDDFSSLMTVLKVKGFKIRPADVSSNNEITVSYKVIDKNEVLFILCTYPIKTKQINLNGIIYKLPLPVLRYLYNEGFEVK